MRPLSSYIEYLLMTRHYVFVPGIGGFMLQEEDSMMLHGGRLMPQHRMLKFNRFMDHNDGMLCNTIMQVEGLSYDEANAAISLHVSDTLNRVQHEGRCQLGRLGYIFFDQDCHIAFIAADQMDNDPVNYGLQTLQLRTWQEIENERTGHIAQAQQQAQQAPVVEISRGHRTDVIELPKVWLRRVAMIVLILTFFFANIIIGKKQEGKQQYANIVSTEVIVKAFNTLDSQSWNESWEKINTDSLIATVSADLVSDLNDDAAGLLDNTASSKAPESEVKVAEAPKPEKEYLIVVGSSTSLEDAKYIVHRLGKQGYTNLSILPRDGRYRVFINMFDIKADAESYLNDLRENTQFKDAWLLAVRTESLSHIIKNKDNDKLPMELSHPNTTAERDQG